MEIGECNSKIESGSSDGNLGDFSGDTDLTSSSHPSAFNPTNLPSLFSPNANKNEKYTLKNEVNIEGRDDLNQTIYRKDFIMVFILQQDNYDWEVFDFSLTGTWYRDPEKFIRKAQEYGKEGKQERKTEEGTLESV